MFGEWETRGFIYVAFLPVSYEEMNMQKDQWAIYKPRGHIFGHVSICDPTLHSWTGHFYKKGLSGDLGTIEVWYSPSTFYFTTWFIDAP